MSLLLYEVHNESGKYALIEEGELYEYGVVRQEASFGSESIYLGKTIRNMKSPEAAFVRLDAKTDGFLPYSELKGAAIPRPGDAVLVQVKRPALGAKAAYLSCDIALPGHYVVYLPYGTRNRISHRASDEEIKDKLRSLSTRLPRAEGSFILRLGSEEVPEGVVYREAKSLMDEWAQMLSAARLLSAPRLLKKAPHPLDRLVRDLKTPPDEILTNVPNLVEALGLPVRLVNQPLLLHQVQEKLSRSLRRFIPLRSGGTLVIDPCEAMTVIDVNSASDAKRSGKDGALTAINCEAAKDIARILRLRGIGGMILIDFIDMDQDDERERVLTALQQALQGDRIPTTIHGFTTLGILELTRKRSDIKLEAERGTCPHCGGSGIISEVN